MLVTKRLGKNELINPLNAHSHMQLMFSHSDERLIFHFLSVIMLGSSINPEKSDLKVVTAGPPDSPFSNLFRRDIAEI